jgi:hypothetical protein
MACAPVGKVQHFRVCLHHELWLPWWDTTIIAWEKTVGITQPDKISSCWHQHDTTPPTTPILQTQPKTQVLDGGESPHLLSALHATSIITPLPCHTPSTSKSSRQQSTTGPNMPVTPVEAQPELCCSQPKFSSLPQECLSTTRLKTHMHTISEGDKLLTSKEQPAQPCCMQQPHTSNQTKISTFFLPSTHVPRACSSRADCKQNSPHRPPPDSPLNPLGGLMSLSKSDDIPLTQKKGCKPDAAMMSYQQKLSRGRLPSTLDLWTSWLCC